MLLFNEKFQQLNVEALKTELKNELDIPVPGEEEIEEDLGTYYTEAQNLEAENYGFELLTIKMASD